VPKLEMDQLEKEDKKRTILNNPSLGSPRVCAPGHFSGAGRTASPRRTSSPRRSAPASPGLGKSGSRSDGRPGSASKTKRMTYGDNFGPDSKAYRVGGGFVSRPPPPKQMRSPEKLDKDDLRLKVAESVSLEASAPSKKLNERQWEKVVTRLYGTPGGADDPANKTKQVNKSKGDKGDKGPKLHQVLHPVEIDRAVDRLYGGTPGKEEWLIEQRINILDKELRSCKTKPTISKTSERMATGKLHIVDRVNDIIRERQQKMAELISSVEAEEGGAIKGSPYISPRAKAIPRTYQDLMSWDAERTERLQQQREAKVVDEISCPFHPEIDEYSEELALRTLHKEGLTELPVEERLYSLRELPSEDQVRTARMIHQEDLKHSLALSAEY